MIAKYNEFILEKYSYKEIKSPSGVSYTFTNKDNIKFNVYFDTSGGDRYTREYRIDSDKYGAFEEIKTNDVMGIIKTVTDITISFINKYQPDEIVITHIPSTKEKVEHNKEEDDEFWETFTTKRATVNKRFLEKKIPFNYYYELQGNVSYITKESY